MKVHTDMTTRRPDEIGSPQDTRSDNLVNEHAPRKLSFAENVILTIKMLAVAAVVLAALWGINVWTAGK